MILTVLTHPNALLRRTHQKVTNFDSELANFCNDLFETMDAYLGVGLAAMQVGDQRSIFVMDTRKVDPSDIPEEAKRKKWIVINPTITHRSKESQKGDEGCLSVPGLFSSVNRSQHIRLDYQDEHGTAYSIEASGYLAVCFQHEFDHLLGKLYIDHLPSFKRTKLLKHYNSDFIPEEVAHNIAMHEPR